MPLSVRTTGPGGTIVNDFDGLIAEAKRAGMPERTARKLCALAKVPARKFGRSWVVQRGALAAYAAATKAK